MSVAVARRAPLAASLVCLLRVMATGLTPGVGLAAEFAAPTPLVPSVAGDEVLDPRAHIAWARCVEGMRWDGKTCSGQPQRLDYRQALALAAARAKADGLAWRLSRVAELGHLVERDAHAPGADAALFPAAPRDWHWAGTVNVGTRAVNPYNYGSVMQGYTGGDSSRVDFQKAWAVNLRTGEARGDAARSSTLPVRLVRSLPN